MEDLLKLDYFNLVREKLEGISSLKSFCRLKTVCFCLFVCFKGGGRRGDFLFAPKYSLPRGPS